MLTKPPVQKDLYFEVHDLRQREIVGYVLDPVVAYNMQRDPDLFIIERRTK